MRKIQMVDLKGQYERIKENVDRAIGEVIEETSFINGPQVKLFAEELKDYNNVASVIPCANGTDALQIAMMALNFKPGDEVIVPAFTYVATVEVIVLLGLKPIFIDVDPFTFNLNVDQLQSKITSKTVGVVPVHLFGQCAEMESIIEIAEKYDIKIVEDAAQSIGSEYSFSNGKISKAGTMGNVGTTSFFPSKNLGCFGDGGALFTNDEKLGEQLKMIANHGQKVKYYHETTGVNSRLDTLQAAILRVKLRELDEYIARRNEAATFYDKAFKDSETLITPERASNSTHVFHQYTLVTNGINRDELKQYLSENNIPSMVYYPIPLPFQKAYKSDNIGLGEFPVTENLCKRVISLPMHTELTSDQQGYIAEKVLNFNR